MKEDLISCVEDDNIIISTREPMQHWRPDAIEQCYPSSCIFIVNKQLNNGLASILIFRIIVTSTLEEQEISNKTVPAQEEPSKVNTILELQHFSEDSLVANVQQIFIILIARTGFDS